MSWERLGLRVRVGGFGTCLFVALSLVSPTHATIAGVNGRIAFASDRAPGPVVTSGAPGSLETDVYTIRPDGSSRAQLTETSRTDGIVAWSPDGSKIAFVSTRDGNGEVYVIDWDGANEVRLTDHPAPDTQPRWSPDGTRLVFVSARTGNLELFVMDADGGDLAQLTHHAAADTWPEFSPSGDGIAFTSDRSGASAIYTIDAEGGNLQKLTADALEAGQPDWSPHGGSIVFVNNLCSKCPAGRPLSDIHTMNLSGGEIRKVTHSFGNNLNPSWSPDGDKIAFWHAPASPATNNTDIYSINVNGSALTNITRTPTLREYVPDWGVNAN